MKMAELSRKEVLRKAAELIAGTLDTEKMGVKKEEANIKKSEFVQDFIKASEEEKFPLTLSIGTWLTENGKRFSGNLEKIMDKMPEKYEFFDGIHIYACEHDLYANYCL